MTSDPRSPSSAAPTKPPPPRAPTVAAEPVGLSQARSETWLALLSFLLVGLWVVGVSFALGHRDGVPADQPVPTVLGLPSWTVWGMLLPWLVCTLGTVAYALLAMPDQNLEPVPVPAEAAAAETADAKPRVGQP